GPGVDAGRRPYRRKPALDCGEQHSHIENWFGDVIVKPDREILFSIADHGMSRERDDWKISKVFFISESTKYLRAVHFRERNIEYDDIRRISFETIQRLGATREFQNLKLIFKDRADDQPVVSVVIHYGYLAHQDSPF